MIDLLWVFIPVVIMMIIYFRWTKDTLTLPYALIRMLTQLLLIGYVLTYIFTSNSSYLIILILSVMLIAGSIIALRPLQKKNRSLYLYAFISILIGGIFTLALVIFGVLNLTPWYEAKFLIPLSGMIFANAMNSVSIAAERFESEMVEKNGNYIQARAVSYKAAFIPTINALFAVGLVSLPGMMTGQILSGIDPLIAVRYQMMVMLMILGSSGISVAIYLSLVEKSGMSMVDI